MSSDDLRAHLEFFAELGIDGVRPGSTWQGRVDPEPAAMPPPVAAEPQPVAPVVIAEAPSTAPVAVFASPAEALAAIRSDIGECTRCKLHTLGRTQVVFGVGDPN